MAEERIEQMRVMSLFDGMSCGRVALERAGIPVKMYIASEIDKYAIKVARYNYPNTIHLGDVRRVRQMAEAGVFGRVDLLIGGSPCQGFSFAGKQLAFNDPRSVLFFEYIGILNALKRWNPNILFMLENVKMKKQFLDIISGFLGVMPVRINSALVSAQNRVRYYWCNWKVEQPADRGIYLRDIIIPNPENVENHVLSEKAMERARRKVYSSPQVMPDKTGTLNTKNNSGQLSLDAGTTLIPVNGIVKLANSHPSGAGMNGWIYDPLGKAPTLTTNKGEGPKVANRDIVGVSKTKNGFRPYKDDGCKGSLTEIGTIATPDNKAATVTVANVPKFTRSEDIENIVYRKLTVVECERLQGLRDKYTGGGQIVSDTQAYKMLGNGWQVDTIEHIFRAMPAVSHD